jgi:hypothetical protein
MAVKSVSLPAASLAFFRAFPFRRGAVFAGGSFWVDIVRWYPHFAPFSQSHFVKMDVSSLYLRYVLTRNPGNMARNRLVTFGVELLLNKHFDCLMG